MDKKSVFPEANESDFLELLIKLKSLTSSYITDKEKVRYLLNLLNYLDGIINGDNINEFATYQYMTPLAKKALKELVDEIHGNILESYKMQKVSLQTEVQQLQQDYDNLSIEVNELSEARSFLQSETKEMNEEYIKLTASLQDEKENGMAKVHSDVAAEKEKVQAEIAKLQSEKESLTKVIEELRNSLNTYSAKIARLNKPQESVVWNTIESNHAIYNANATTIDRFIEGLKLEYMEKTSCSSEECDKVFAANAPELDSFAELLKNVNFDENDLNNINPSVNVLLNYSYIFDTDKNRFRNLKGIKAY